MPGSKPGKKMSPNSLANLTHKVPPSPGNVSRHRKVNNFKMCLQDELDALDPFFDPLKPYLTNAQILAKKLILIAKDDRLKVTDQIKAIETILAYTTPKPPVGITTPEGEPIRIIEVYLSGIVVHQNQALP